MEREVSETGSIDSFGLLLPETFTSEIYTEIYVQVDGAKELESYSTSYEKTVKQVQNRVEELEEEACQRRYDTVYQEGEEKLSDARKQVADGEKELADGKKDAGRRHFSDQRGERYHH